MLLFYLSVHCGERSLQALYMYLLKSGLTSVSAQVEACLLCLIYNLLQLLINVFMLSYSILTVKTIEKDQPSNLLYMHSSHVFVYTCKLIRQYYWNIAQILHQTKTTQQLDSTSMEMLIFKEKVRPKTEIVIHSPVPTLNFFFYFVNSSYLYNQS